MQRWVYAGNIVYEGRQELHKDLHDNTLWVECKRHILELLPINCLKEYYPDAREYAFKDPVVAWEKSGSRALHSKTQLLTAFWGAKSPIGAITLALRRQTIVRLVLPIFAWQSSLQI